jgi:hypothetical protein
LEPQIPINLDLIELLARGIIGQLAPLTGTRATGAVLVENDSDDELVIAKNTYLIPVVGSHIDPDAGELRYDLVFKTTPNPDTLEEHGVGGSWTVPAHDTLEIGIQSNTGGAQHNLLEGTLFQWDPPIDTDAARVPLVADMTSGEAPEESTRVAVQRIQYFEDLNANAIERDIQSARLQLPGILLTWEASTPGEGRTAGTNQGSTRLSAGKRLFMETFRLFVVVGHQGGDSPRRGSGLRILQACTRLLSDQETTRDFERLASNGSLEITARNRFARDERHYVYSLAFRVQRIYSVLEARTFIPWLKTHIIATLPGRDDPEPTDPITMVDVTDPMPPGVAGPPNVVPPEP